MPKIIWNINLLKREAAKYKSRGEFNKGSRAAYKAAWARGFLSEICQHMVRPKPQRKWTVEKLKLEALKYSTRTEFARSVPGAYQAAIKENCLDTCCIHMAKSKRLTDYPDLTVEWNYSKNRGSYPEDFSKGAKKKVWWECRYGHEWQAFVYNRTNGTGCPKCSNQSSKNEVRLYRELSAIYSNVLHREKVSGYEVDVLLSEESVAIEYDGKYAHQGLQKAKADAKKYDALVAMGYRVLRVREYPLTRLGATDIIIPTSSMLTKEHLNDVVSWIDKKTKETVAYLNQDNFIDHESYQADLLAFPAPERHLSLAGLFPELATEWHPTKNAGRTPYLYTPGSKERVWWQCKNNKDHVWEATIQKRSISKRGCCFCSSQATSIDNCLEAKQPDVAALWHPTANGDSTPRSVVPGSTKIRWWRCLSDPSHEWQATPRKLTRMKSNNFCPMCRVK